MLFPRTPNLDDTPGMMMRTLSIFTLLVALLLVVQPSSTPAQEPGEGTQVPIVTDFPLPKTLVLCGEPVPLKDRWVWEMLDRELTIAAWDRAQVFMWLKRAGRHFPYMEKTLAKRGMPEDLKYLAVAESSLRTHIISPKGATGPWQFMSDTARRNGLRNDRTMDERRDFARATEAALNYLENLKEIFGSWTLAMAAYNCGESRLEREIEEQKVRNYYLLNLPSETERFIYRIAAIKVVMEDPARYGYRVPKGKIYKPINYDEIGIKVNVPVHLTEMAKGLGTHLKTLKDLNPQIIGYYLPSGSYTLKVPPGKGREVKPLLKNLERKGSSPRADRSKKYYIVNPGDTLTQISADTGVPLSRLQKINGLTGSLIKVGQKLQLGP